MEALRKTTEELDEKIAQIELRLVESKEAGRSALKARNRTKVAQHARAVKALNGQLSQLSAMKANLFERELAEEMAALTKNYTDAIAGALKQNKKGTFDVDKAISTIDSAQEHMDDLNEFSEAVRDATEAAAGRDDEDDIEALFREDEVFDDPTEEVKSSLTRDEVGPAVPKHKVTLRDNQKPPPPNQSLLDKKLAGITL